MNKILVLTLALTVGAVAQAKSGKYFCPDLGGHPMLMAIDGDSMTVTGDFKGDTTGKKQANSPDGYTAYGDFRANGFMRAGDQLNVSNELLQKGSGKVQLTEPNVNPYWEATCHTFSSADKKNVSCESQIKATPVIDKQKAKPQVEATASPTVYQYTLKDEGAGDDIVYDVEVSRNGPFCILGDMTPVSCPAVVLDAVSDKARKDGSSSGMPFIRANADGSYMSGIHDEESGEFIYKVEVSKRGSSCTVKSMKTVSDN